MITQIIEYIPNALLAAALIGILTFVVSYTHTSDWRSTAAGRALLYLMGSMSLILMMSFFHLLIDADYHGVEFVRIGVYALFTAAIWRLVGVLYDAQKLSWLSWLGIRRTEKKKRKKG